MADDEYDETEDGEEPEARNGGGQSLVDALTSKELLIPAALSAASAVAATEGQIAMRRGWRGKKVFLSSAVTADTRNGAASPIWDTV